MYFWSVAGSTFFGVATTNGADWLRGTDSPLTALTSVSIPICPSPNGYCTMLPSACRRAAPARSGRRCRGDAVDLALLPCLPGPRDRALGVVGLHRVDPLEVGVRACG